jgi:hypothetical protein
MKATPDTAAIRAAPRPAVLGIVCAALLFGCGARTGIDRGEAIDAGMDAPPDASHDAGADAPSDVAIDAGTDAPIVDAGADAPDVFTIDAGDPCEIGAEPLRDPLCTRLLFGNPPTPSCAGGFVDVAAQGEGTLSFECDGSRAEARFGSRTYRGSRVGDEVALCIRTEFDYVDGCRWQSSQRIEGALSDPSLTLTYREVTIAGMSCFPPCTADSVVDLR